MPNKSKLILYNYRHSYNIQLLKVVQHKSNQSRLMEQHRGSEKHTLMNMVQTVNTRVKAIQLFHHVPLWDSMNYSTPGLPFHHLSWSLLRLMTIESVMTSNHLILCHPLFLLPSIFPSFRVFSNESALHIRWSKYWSFSFSINPSNEYSG